MRPAPVAIVFVLSTTFTAPVALAQAWVDPAGRGAITVAFQAIENTGHILTDGSTAPVGKSRTASAYVQVDYALTDRFSISVGLPFVFAKYLGPRPAPGEKEPPMVQLVDLCYCWQKGWQDFGFVARYSVLNGPTAITPSIELGAPSHDYDYRGEAVVGRNLKEIRVAIDAGQRLTSITPRLAVLGRYSYSIVERVLDVPNNRSNASLEGAYQFTHTLNVRGTVARQITHGGLRTGTGPPGGPDGIPWGEITTPELFQQHDRLLRDNYWRLGVGTSIVLPHADLFFSYLAYVAGSDTHAGRAISAGLTVPFGKSRP